jgi:bifunctional polynucleotide phosphatase/kinase
MSKQGQLNAQRSTLAPHLLIPHSSASTSKRPLDRAASPPPAAKLTKLASMFAPASSKEPSLFTWLPPLAGCMHGVYDSSNFKGSTKVAAFDLDGTVIAPRSGNKFPKDKDDWKYWNGTVPKVIRDLHADGWVPRPSIHGYELKIEW